MNTQIFILAGISNVSLERAVLSFCLCFFIVLLISIPKYDFWYQYLPEIKNTTSYRKKSLISVSYFKSRLKR